MTRDFICTLALLCCSGCSVARVHDVDLLCGEIVDFANATPVGEEHYVKLVGGWGGERRDTLITHNCMFQGYSPGEKICSYLVPNSSWEFGELNAERAFACLDPTSEKVALSLLKQESLVVEVSADNLPGLEVGVSLRVEFGPRPNPEHTALKFVVRRD